MNKANRFQNLSDALKGQHLPEQVEEKNDFPLVSKKKVKRGGKRSDPNFVQIGVYVNKDLHLEIKKLLLSHPNIDMSDLVGQLLQRWVEEQQSD
ncbi:MAG: hypothetical protein AAGF83_05055 [Cyanobacteria bacterium P01_G01_bin.67]